MLQQSFIIALLVLAIWYVFQEGEIFGFVQRWENKLGKLFQPLFGCNVCQTPYYGSILYWLIYGLWLHVATWQNWLVVVFCAMGINACINKLAPDK